jgi:hypothetical protein
MYFMTLLVALIVRMTNKWWTGKDIEGNDLGIIEEVPPYMPGVSEELHEKPESE